MPKLAPDRFTRFLEQTVLRDISIWSVSADRVSDDIPEGVEIGYAEKAELKSSVESRAVIFATFGVRIRPKGGDDTLAELRVTLRAVYEVPEKMAPEIYRQFEQVSLRIHTVPFAREWFRDMSARMGMEPIILPLALAHPAAARRPRRTTKGKRAA